MRKSVSKERFRREQNLRQKAENEVKILKQEIKLLKDKYESEERWYHHHIHTYVHR